MAFNTLKQLKFYVNIVMFNSILTICSPVCFKILSILLLNKDNRLQKVSVIDSMHDSDLQKGNIKV